MILQFNADEVFAMAEQLEQNANTFYRKAASFTKNASACALFEELAKWELTHIDTFTKMRNDLAAEFKEALVFDPEDETWLYLKAIADSHVFDMRKDVKDTLKGDETVPQIVKVALKMEKDSIIFYLGIKDMIPSDAGKDKVNDIIREEMRHIAFLNRELKTFE